MIPLSHQEIVEKLDLMLRARYPLIYIVGAEEEPIETVLLQVADKSPTSQRIAILGYRQGLER
jgi:hypothetical protein